MRILTRLRREEEGQAIILLGLAMSFFLIAAVGLGIDGSHLYSEHQMAQVAADAAAQAAMMSIYDATNGSGAHAFTATAGSSFTCTTTDLKTPCVYAASNGFGTTAGDTVTVAFSNTGPAGVTVSNSYSPAVTTVTISRPVSTFLIRFAGATSTTVYATATAAIVSDIVPIPLLINHPTLSGALQTNGGVLVTICGGPHRSIEVNSSSTSAISVSGGGTVNLQKAGPPDPGNCTTGNGADFGVWGGPSSAPFTYQGGTNGRYLPGASWMKDPLAGVSPPTSTGLPNGVQTVYGWGTGPCPASTKPHGCTFLTPGIYPTGIALTTTTAYFEPGIYYIQSGGFTCGSNCNALMVTGTADPAPPAGTGTGWDGTQANGGMLVYNTGSGQISVGSNGSANLVGSPQTCAAGVTCYDGILFFEDHAAAANKTPTNHDPHVLGGGGAMSLYGTIYLTNTRATMLGDASHYQELDLQGSPGNTTLVQGEIIVDALSLGGNSSITMNLNSSNGFVVSQVALVQ